MHSTNPEPESYRDGCQMPWVRGIRGKEILKKEVEEILGN